MYGRLIDQLLNDIRYASRPDESVYLINVSGNYLASSDKTKEIYSGNKPYPNFYDDYRGAKSLKNSKQDQGPLTDNDHIFTYINIYPSIGNFQVYKGSEKLFGKSPEKLSSMTLISVSSRKGLSSSSQRQNNVLLAYIISGIFVVLIFGMFIAVEIIYHKDRISVILNKNKK